MAKQVSARTAVSVRLLTLELSEGELEVLTICLNYVLDHVDHQTLEQLTGAYPDEVAAIRDDLSQWLNESVLESPEDEIPDEMIQEPT